MADDEEGRGSTRPLHRRSSNSSLRNRVGNEQSFESDGSAKVLARRGSFWNLSSDTESAAQTASGTLPVRRLVKKPSLAEESARRQHDLEEEAKRARELHRSQARAARELFSHPKHLLGFLGRRVRVTHPPAHDKSALTLVAKSGLCLGLRPADVSGLFPARYEVLLDDGRNALIGRAFLKLDPWRAVPVDLTFSAQLTRIKDLFSLSDPFLRLLVEGPEGRWYELGRTESLLNTQDPVWTKPILVDWRPGSAFGGAAGGAEGTTGGDGTRGLLKIEVYEESHKLRWGADRTCVDHHELQGECWFNLAELMDSPTRTLTLVSAIL